MTGSQNFYDPLTRMVCLRPDASAYAVAHEYAHRDQHAENSLVWRIYWACRFVPVFSWASTLLLEWDALRRAKATLWAKHSGEAWEAWRTYLTCQASGETVSRKDHGQKESLPPLDQL